MCQVALCVHEIPLVRAKHFANNFEHFIYTRNAWINKTGRVAGGASTLAVAAPCLLCQRCATSTASRFLSAAGGKVVKVSACVARWVISLNSTSVKSLVGESELKNCTDAIF
jgi:hypothetical protein